MNKLIKIFFYIIAIFTIGLLSGHFTFKLMSFSKTVKVPDLKGKSMVEANNILRSKNLYIRLEGEDHDSYIPQGYIMRQDVPPGNSVKEKREIGIILSKGPRIKYVPDVVGQTIDMAEAVLKEKGIRIGKIIYVHSDKVPKNIIVAQRPETNEKGGENFSVLVSLGNYEN
jgi:serine/threonine-protein kinase